MTYPTQPPLDRGNTNGPGVPPVYAPSQPTAVQPVTDPERAARLAALQARQRHDDTRGHTMTVASATASSPSPRRGPKRNHPAQSARTVALAGSVAATAALAMYMAGSDGVALTDTVVQSASAANESSLDTVPTAEAVPTVVLEVPTSELVPNDPSAASGDTAPSEATDGQSDFAEAAAQAIEGESAIGTDTADANQISAFETTDSAPTSAAPFAESEAETSSSSQPADDSFTQSASSEAASAPVATATPVPVPTATAVVTEAPAEATAPVDEPATSTTGYADGDYVGSAQSTPWGDFQVQATISGGKLVSVDVIQSPSDHHSSRINSRAVPTLLDEALSVQDADIANVSGATWTSRSYKASLQAALDQAFTQGAAA